MVYVALILVGIVLALLAPVAYNRWKSNKPLDPIPENLRDRVSAAEDDRARRNAERYEKAKELAKNATITDAVDAWGRARERLRGDRVLGRDPDRDKGSPR